MDFLRSVLNEAEFLANTRENAQIRKIPVLDYSAGRFMEALCFLIKPEKMVEIGCGIGYSTYFLLKHFTEMTGKSKAEAGDCRYTYTGIDLNKKRLEEAREFIKGAFPQLYASGHVKISFISGNAIKMVPKLNEKYDFVFIDAAKFEYPQYLAAVEPKLQKGAIIVADNIFYSGKIFKGQISAHDKNSVNGLKEFIGNIQSGDKYSTKFYDISDGISVSIYK
jgi:predicted O-methyltransferase YrrM